MVTAQFCLISKDLTGAQSFMDSNFCKLNLSISTGQKYGRIWQRHGCPFADVLSAATMVAALYPRCTLATSALTDGDGALSDTPNMLQRGR